jgi:RHS repeat-associated protein
MILENIKITEKYLWLNQTTLLAVLDKDNNIKYRFTYVDERTPISYTDKQNNIFYLSYNHLGSLKAITDKNNQIVKQIDYDSFGNIIDEIYYDNTGNIIQKITYDSSGNIINDTNPSNTKTLNIPIGFAGGLYDKDTKLTKFGYRDYDSNIGRWTSKDPIDFNGGDSNLYGYVLGDPVNFVDPSGLAWTDYIPDFPQWLVDGSAGFGDAISWGLTEEFRKEYGYNNAVSQCSTSYKVGDWGGFGLGLGKSLLKNGVKKGFSQIQKGINWRTNSKTARQTAQKYINNGLNDVGRTGIKTGTGIIGDKGIEHTVDEYL